MGSNSIFQAMRVFIGSNQSQDNHSKEGVLGKITNFSSQINKSLLFPEMPKVKGPKLFQKGSHPRIKNEYLKQSIPSWYTNEFKIKWSHGLYKEVSGKIVLTVLRIHFNSKSRI